MNSFDVFVIKGFTVSVITNDVEDKNNNFTTSNQPL